jgi:hypothetical protein
MVISKAQKNKLVNLISKGQEWPYLFRKYTTDSRVIARKHGFKRETSFMLGNGDGSAFGNNFKAHIGQGRPV